MGLGGVETEPGFGEHMLAGLQGGQRDRAVQIRPGADDDGVNVAAIDQFLPVFIAARNAKLTGGGGRGSRPTVTHGHDFDIRECPQAGDVPQLHVGPDADQADS